MFRAAHRPSSGAQKTVIAASGFTYVFGCRPLRWLSHRSCNRQPKTYVKPDTEITDFWAPDDGQPVTRNMLSN